MDEMQDKSDIQLLRDFAGKGDEAAFRKIVMQHTDLVYSAALRQVESRAAAADIAQSVFTDLARKASTLTGGRKTALSNSLAGWLHRATRYAALNYLRDARRRATNERQAMEQLLTNSESSSDWEQIRPILDEALDSLGDEDREALLLRYLKNQDFRAVGLALNVSDDAAQKRVSRAVERLREFFSKRSVTIGASGLTVLISANAVQSAPVGLAAAISAAALLTGTAVTTSTAVAVTKTIAMTALQKTLVTITVAALAGAGIYETRHVARLRSHSPALLQPQSLQTPPMQAGRDDANAKVSGLQDNTESGSNAVTSTRDVATNSVATSQEVLLPVTTNSQPVLELLKSSWTNAGFATPEAALKTRGWSVLNGDRELFSESLFITPGARKMIEDKLVQMASASTDPNRNQFIQEAVNNKWGAEEAMLIPMMALNQQQGFASYHILSEQSPAAGQMVLDVETEMNSGPPQEDVFKFQQFGNDWKIVIDGDSLQSMR